MSDDSREGSPAKEEKEEEMKEEQEEGDESMEAENADESKEEKETPKKEKKEEKGKTEEEEKSSDEEDEEEEASPKIGILEMPVVLEKGAKRERKKVQRLAFQSPSSEEKKLEVEQGKGTALGDIPYIEYKIGKTRAEELKPLHRVLFRKVGSNNECKKNIRKFSGFWFSKSDDEYKKRFDMMIQLKFKVPIVKGICEVLDLQKKGTKEEIVTRVLDFLMEPSDSGRKAPETKRKRKPEKEKKEEKKQKKSKAKKDSDDEDEDEEEEEEEEEKEEDEDEDDEEEEDESESEKPPKKKTKKVSAKKEEKKKEVKKKEEKPKKKEGKAQKKAVSKKKTEDESDVSDISDSEEDSDDEPLVKKAGPPTNDELKDLIKKMLDSANLEEVTMKTVLKDVYAKYPNHDLSDRKEFIKNTVKQIIS